METEFFRYGCTCGVLGMVIRMYFMEYEPYGQSNRDNEFCVFE